MDSERALKIALRRAVGEVLRPAPWRESAVREDLRRRRSSRSGSRAQDKPRMVWPRSAMQFAAALLVVVLAAAALAEDLDLRERAAPLVHATLFVTAYQNKERHLLALLLSSLHADDCLSPPSTSHTTLSP